MPEIPAPSRRWVGGPGGWGGETGGGGGEEGGGGRGRRRKRERKREGEKDGETIERLTKIRKSKGLIAVQVQVPLGVFSSGFLLLLQL